MQRDQHLAAVVALQPLAALGHNAHLVAHQGHRRGRTERDEGLRFHDGDLVVEPVVARGHFALRRRLVDAPLAAQFVLEVLDGVGDEHLGRRHAGFLECARQQLARGADEGVARLVLLVAGLLANQHQLGFRVAFADHRLRAHVADRAFAATHRRSLQRVE